MYDAVIPTQKHEEYIISDHVLNKRQVADIITKASFIDGEFGDTKRIVIGSDVGFSKKGILFPHNDEGLRSTLLRGDCYYYNAILNYSCRLIKQECTFYDDNGLPQATSRYCCPWRYGDWDKAYNYYNAFNDLGYGVEFKPKKAQFYKERVRLYGIKFVPRYAIDDNSTNGPVSFKDENTWKMFRNLNDEL